MFSVLWELGSCSRMGNLRKPAEDPCCGQSRCQGLAPLSHPTTRACTETKALESSEILHCKSFFNLTYFSSSSMSYSFANPLDRTESLCVGATTEFGAEELIQSLTTSIIKILKNYLTTHLISTAKPVQIIPAPSHRQSSSACLHSHQVTSIFQAKNLLFPLAHWLFQIAFI